MPPAITNAVPTTGIVTTQPGKTVVASNTNPTTITIARPLQLKASPITRGNPNIRGAITASNAPIASSCARVNGEKYAAVPFSVFRNTDHQRDPRMIPARRIPSRIRKFRGFPSQAIPNINTSQTR